jgi:hypothetical protein
MAKNAPRVNGTLRVKLLPKVSSFRLAGRRYFPGDEIELTQEQADRFNPDLFAKIEPPATEQEPTVPAAPVLQFQEAATPQKFKSAAKKPSYARKHKP